MEETHRLEDIDTELAFIDEGWLVPKGDAKPIFRCSKGPVTLEPWAWTEGKEAAAKL